MGCSKINILDFRYGYTYLYCRDFLLIYYVVPDGTDVAKALKNGRQILEYRDRKVPQISFVATGKNPVCFQQIFPSEVVGVPDR